jgi:hypothetical protein
VRLPLLLLFASAAALAAGPPAPPTAADIVTRVSAARGGAAKLAAIRSVRFTGTGQSGGFKAGIVRTLARPGSVREELSIQGLTQVLAWNGSSAWQINPFSGRRTADKMDAEDAKGLALDAEIEGPLLAAAARGLPMSWQGVATVDGSPAWQVRIQRPGGDVQDVYVDPDSALEIKVVTRMTVHGVVEESETAYADYEYTKGVLFPMQLALGAKNHAQEGFLLTFDKVELGVATPATLFEMPR